MKFLECPDLLNLTSFLTSIDTGDSIIRGKIECYSCKQTVSDRRLSKELDELVASSPSSSNLSHSPLGDLAEMSTRRLFTQLIATLNSSFPDYDFSNASPDSFSLEQKEAAMEFINRSLVDPINKLSEGFGQQLWQTIHQHIDLSSCDVFCYLPAVEEEDVDAPLMWSLNYFFHNRKLKKVLFLSACAFNHSYLDPAEMPEAESESVFPIDEENENVAF
eukprot:TRINITY_DN10887_c0_g1_i6.p1 TRINITY_DN10887_c0_g1~~TRINITY_DN10887_c0_g1_i6.p1  ORF type:complete len:248 (+),score=47.81 TRINITY_DN10887_c0_g1_i6:90-746(+)